MGSASYNLVSEEAFSNTELVLLSGIIYRINLCEG